MVGVSVAIPLHASAPWVDNVVRNVRTLPDMVTEVLISDRTCRDDAASRIRERLSDDGRVRVVAEPRDLGWATHCQLLIEETRGELMMLMPHDDGFDASWVPVLRQALADHPQALLAYGRIEMVQPDGSTPDRFWAPHPRRPGLITGWDAVGMMVHGQLGVAFRGLLRRREVLAHGIRLPRPCAFRDESPGVDQLWALAMALRGALVFDDRTVTHKRRHPASLTAASGPIPMNELHLAALGVVREFGPGGFRGASMAARLWIACARSTAIQSVRRLSRTWSTRSRRR